MVTYLAAAAQCSDQGVTWPDVVALIAFLALCAFALWVIFR